MDLTIAQTVGVDISKDMLDVHLHPDNLARRFSNNSKGFTALIDWLAQQNRAQRIIFEPTGAGRLRRDVEGATAGAVWPAGSG